MARATLGAMNYDVPGVAVSDRAMAGGRDFPAAATRGRLNRPDDHHAPGARRWQLLHRGVYAVFNGPPRRAAWLWAAVLRAGPGAVLSHLTAAELHGLHRHPAEAIFVTVPSTRRIRHPASSSACPARIGEATPAQPRATPDKRRGDRARPGRARRPSTMPAAGLPGPAAGGSAPRKSSARPWRRARKCAGGPSSAMSSRPPETASTRCSNTGICAMSSGPTACRGPDIKCASSSMARPSYRDAYYDEYQLAVELDGRLAHPGRRALAR